MCGINGILRLDDGAPALDGEELRRTRDAMARRGPDGRGLWLSPRGRAALGHRRLSIIDLSDAGAQPLSRENGRYRIVFNGEIYNYRELRRGLEGQGVRFDSRSDTEVVLALYAREGEKMLSRLRGMYALAIWDEREGVLLLARDPYGIKPLYYATDGHCFRFGSQVKALLAGGGLSDEIDPAGLAGFLLWGSVPEPYTLYRGIRALPAGHYLVAGPEGVGPPRAHHSFDDDAAEPPGDLTEALERSVGAHLVSDVPVAVFLSAGLDSALIAALAQRQVAEPLTALTLTFDEYRDTAQDEGPLAAEVARAIGARHVRRRVKQADFLDLWPRALQAMDQPSIDGFNTYVVSKVAHDEGFKVVLSGLGGDELFGSYDSFRDVPRWRGVAAALSRLPGLAASWPTLARRLRPDKPKLEGLLDVGATLPGAYFLRRGLFLPSELRKMLGRRLADDGLGAYDAVLDAGKLLAPGAEVTDAWPAVHLMESTQYMRNQLLRDSDWASMAHSVELRVPLVDAWLRRSVAAAGFEPARSGSKAAVVRQAAGELPAALWNRPKSGFSIPVMRWVDAQVGLDTHPGAASRMLALRVLEQFGVDLGEPLAPVA